MQSFVVHLAWVAALILSGIQSAPASPATKEAGMPGALKNLEQRYKKAGSVQAHFTQVIESELSGVKKTSQGVLTFKRPNQVRWETQTPDPQLVVSDGKKVWIYTPPFQSGERGQLLIRKTAQVQSRFANALLSGAFSSVKGLKVQVIDKIEYELIPPPRSAGTVVKARVKLDPELKFVQEVYLENEGGNTTQIVLKNVTLGVKLESGFFKFDPPSGTEILNE